MKKLVILCLLLFLCFVLIQTSFSAANSLNQKQFIVQIDAAIAAGDTNKIVGLVRENSFFLIGSTNSILKKYLNHALAGDKVQAETNLAWVEFLARTYQKEFGKSIFIEQFQLFKNWTFKQKKLQITGDSLVQAGIGFARQGNLPQALSHWRAAHKIFRQLQNKFYQPVPLKNIALAHRYLGHYPAAKDTLRLALSLAQQIASKDLEASLLRESGNLHHLTGEPAKSLPYWNDALEIFEKMNNPMEIGITLNSFGIYYRGAGQPERALKFYKRALKFDRIAKNEKKEGNVLNNIGNLYLDYFGEYEKAREYFLKALEIKQRHHETFLFNPIVGNIGLCYQNQGDYTKALDKFFEALKLAQEVKNLDGIAKHLSQIGAVYLDIGMPTESIPYFQQALDTLRSIGDKKQEIETLGHLGDAQKALKNFQAASQSYQSALKLAQRGNFKASIASLMRSSGEIEFSLNRHQQAIELFRKALIISREIQDKREIGYLCLNIGEYFKANDKSSEALDYFKKSLNVGQDIHDQELFWQSLYGTATVYESQQQNHLALDAYKKSIRTIESLRSQLKAVSFRESFLEEKLCVYHAIIRLLIKMGRIEEGFDYLERSKARSFLDILSTGWFNIARGVSPELVDHKKKLEAKLNLTNQALFSEFSKTETNQSQQQIQSLEDTLSFTRRKYQELIQQIQRKHPAYAKLTQVGDPVKLSVVQKALLNENAALIEFLVGKDATYAWIMKENSYVCEKIPLTQDELEKVVNQLLQPFNDFKEGKIKSITNLGFDLNLAQKIYEQLFLPIEKHLTNIENLIIIPDGILFYLPFEMLVSTIDRKPYNREVIFSRLANAHYLLENYVISYAPSANILVQTRSKAAITPPKMICAFGNPDFTLANENLSKTEMHDFFNIYRFLIRSSRGWIFSDLPDAEQEVKTIAKILKPATCYTGAKATEERFKQNGHEYQIIHLATHCIIEETQPMYSRIIFAQDHDPLEDGFLHTYEVFNLKLNAGLVTLGACETGLGKFSRGEGLIGLTRAFIYAGTPSVVVSLWAVSDMNTGLMKNFYQNLKNASKKSVALRNAKLAVIKSKGTFQNGPEFSLAHPFFWAPYVLIGDCDPILKRR